jgi:hypothetical protein
VRDLQVGTEEFEARIAALRDELVTIINDNVAALREEIDLLADEAGSASGKQQRGRDPRLLQTNQGRGAVEKCRNAPMPRPHVGSFSAKHSLMFFRNL